MGKPGSLTLCAPDLDRIRGILPRMAQFAEGLIDLHRLGIPREALQRQFAWLGRDLEGLRVALPAPPPAPKGPGGPPMRGMAAWDHTQSLLYAAGAMMTMGRVRPFMTAEDARRCLAAKIFYEFEAELLDDLIDDGGYGYREAAALVRHGLFSLIDPGFEATEFREGVASLVRPEHRDAVDAMTYLTASFNHLLHGSPWGADLLPMLSRETEMVAEALALSMFQGKPSLDLPALRRGAGRMPPPGPDVAWHENLASHQSWVINHTLIDMSFAHGPLDPAGMEAHLRAWHYYNVAITLGNHVSSVGEDLAAGVANCSLIGMREAELMELPALAGYDPNLTPGDYHGQLTRMARLLGHALAVARRRGNDPGLFYPIVTVMIPTVIIGGYEAFGQALIHPLMAALAPAVREACVAQIGSVATGNTFHMGNPQFPGAPP